MATKATEPPAVLVVLASFVGVLDGVEVEFHKGEPIQPEHPAVRKWPTSFGPIVFPHPIKARPALTTPEIRAGE